MERNNEITEHLKHERTT